MSDQNKAPVPSRAMLTPLALAKAHYDAFQSRIRSANKGVPSIEWDEADDHVRELYIDSARDALAALPLPEKPMPISLPQPTQDQIEYLAKVQESVVLPGDPRLNEIVGGKKAPVPSENMPSPDPLVADLRNFARGWSPGGVMFEALTTAANLIESHVASVNSGGSAVPSQKILDPLNEGTKLAALTVAMREISKRVSDGSGHLMSDRRVLEWVYGKTQAALAAVAEGCDKGDCDWPDCGCGTQVPSHLMPVARAGDGTAGDRQ